MATITLTSIKHLKLLEGPHSGFNGETATIVKVAEVYFDHGGQAVGSGDTMSLALATLIQNKQRNGKTVTVRSACMGKPAFSQTDGIALGYKTVALTAGAITFIPTTSDYSTNVAIDAADIMARDFSAIVTFSEA